MKRVQIAMRRQRKRKVNQKLRIQVCRDNNRRMKWLFFFDLALIQMVAAIFKVRRDWIGCRAGGRLGLEKPLVLTTCLVPLKPDQDVFDCPRLTSCPVWRYDA